MSFTSHDGTCTPDLNADRGCHYSINSLRLHTGAFAVGKIKFQELSIFNWSPVAGEIDLAGIITIPTGTKFNVGATVNGQPSALGVNSNEMAVFISQAENNVGVFGQVHGDFSGHSIVITLMATADSPLSNHPPLAAAGPDQALTTDCAANVQLDSSKTSDPDGNFSHAYYSEHGFSLGTGGSPIPFLPGKHTLTLVAQDTLGGRDRNDVHVNVTDTGVTVPIPGELFFNLQVPASLSPEDVLLDSKASLSLAPRVSLLPATSTIVNLGTAGTSIGVSANVDNIWSRGPLLLDEAATATGSVHTQAPITLKNKATILGPTDEHAVFDPLPITAWNIVLPATNHGDVAINPHQAFAVTPGLYGSVTLKPNATLTLTPGVYIFHDLDIAPGASVQVSGSGSDPTFIYLIATLGYNGPILASGDLLLGFAGSQQVVLKAPFHGTLVATAASLILDQIGAEHHSGAFFASDIQVRPGVVVEHHAFDWNQFRNARSACVLTPVLKCVAAVGGSYVAHFGYANLLTYSGVTVAPGLFNRFDGAQASRGQPVSFLPGSQPDAFTVTFDGQPLTWILGSRSVVASKGSPSCP